MQKTIRKVSVVVVLAGSFVAIWFVLSTLPLEASPALLVASVSVTPTPTPSGEGGTLKGVAMVLVSPAGRVDLVNTPGSNVVRQTVTAGTRVRVLDWMRVQSKYWYLVALDGGAQGWVPAEALVKAGSQKPTFSHFTFCTGDASAPTDLCSTQLPLDTAGLWLRWDYAGLSQYDVVQQVLLVNGERYQGAPLAWNGSGTGQQLVNLMTFAPRREAGLWTVWFVVNGEFAGATSVRVR